MSIFKEKIIIAVGGSLLVPDSIDVSFIRQLKEITKSLISKGYQVILVPGGGKTARNYQIALQELDQNNSDALDWVGVKSIHLNADFLYRAFSDIGVNPVIYQPEELEEVHSSVVIKAAFEPGQSSDAGAVRMANVSGAKRIINFSNTSHVYSADPRTNKDVEKFEKLNDDYKKALHIKTEVTDFFYDVDYRLKQLMDKSLYANNQLTNLQNSFRNQSRIRINLKKLLKFTLEQASYSNKHIITLPKSFPIKSIPIERFKFIEVPYYHTYGIQRNEILPAHYDNEYARSEREKVEKDLFRQESAAKLLREYKSILEEKKELNFTEHFYKILERENDSEIALSVGFDLFQFANSNPRYQIEITKDLPEAYSEQKILVWNMKINQIL